MEKMSVTRALVEKKLLSKRIAQHYQKFEPVMFTVADEAPSGFKSAEAFSEHVKAKLNQLQDELKRYDKIVQAIADSNAKTTVKIAGEEYSVARALEKKKYIATVGASYLEELKRKVADRQAAFDKKNKAEKQKADDEFSAFIGRDKSAKEEEMEAARKIINARHKLTLHDPVNMRKLIDDLESEQEKFMADVDIALTEINSRTEIEI